MPATGISWNEAARFVNWLNTSQGYPEAHKFNTQPGDVEYDANANVDLWEAADAGFDPANPFRNSLAQYFLPSVDEWYKAAYYDADANTAAGGYWDFPTGSDLAPTPVASGLMRTRQCTHKRSDGALRVARDWWILEGVEYARFLEAMALFVMINTPDAEQADDQKTKGRMKRILSEVGSYSNDILDYDPTSEELRRRFEPNTS